MCLWLAKDEFECWEGCEALKAAPTDDPSRVTGFGYTFMYMRPGPLFGIIISLHLRCYTHLTAFVSFERTAATLARSTKKRECTRAVLGQLTLNG